MRKMMYRIFCILILTGLLHCIGFQSPLLAQDVLPQPGQTIDKSNCNEYKHLFPDVFMDAFTTGWEMVEPISIKIKAPVANSLPKEFLEKSKGNQGKYNIDAEGYITGGDDMEIVGLPFPGITPEDDKFVTKFMWNFDYRYKFDDNVSKFINFEKRRGSKATISIVDQWQVSFQNRMFDDPTPLFKTASGIRSVNFLRVVAPPVQKNFITLLIRYIDQKTPDATYLYLPSMRRVLRGEAGQRSTPINSSTQAPDDFEGFAGRIPDFTYKLVEEKKMIVLGDAKLGYTEMNGKSYDNIPVESENWMVKDVYVIDIIPKDDKYPQGRKRIWIDKENYWPYYAAAWDRAGALWKIWHLAVSAEPMSSGGTVPYFKGILGMDIQLGFSVQMFSDWKINGNGLKEADVSPAAMRRRAR